MLCFTRLRAFPDNTLLIYGTETKLEVTKIESNYSHTPIFSKRTPSPVKLADIFYWTDMVAYVTEEDPKTVWISHMLGVQRTTPIHFRSLIVNIMLKRDTITIVLQDKIYIYSLFPFEVRSFVRTEECCALSTLKQTSIAEHYHVIACPGKATGTVFIFNLEKDDNVVRSLISCHAHALQTVTLSRDARLLATTSVVGTLVRVFSVPSQTRRHEFRRGIDSTEILSVVFNGNSTLLLALSNKWTLHVFRLQTGDPSLTQIDASPRLAVLPAPNVTSWFRHLWRIPYYQSTWSCTQLYLAPPPAEQSNLNLVCMELAMSREEDSQEERQGYRCIVCMPQNKIVQGTLDSASRITSVKSII